MSRMRTIDQAAASLAEIDPGCALTKTGLRRLVTTGQLPSVKIGNKYLIDLDVLESYLRGSVPPPIYLPVLSDPLWQTEREALPCLHH